MSKVSVLDPHKRVLEPCHPAVARRLLREGQAAVYKRYPFTIILKREVPNPQTTDYTLPLIRVQNTLAWRSRIQRITSLRALSCTIAARQSKKVYQHVRGIAVADVPENSATVNRVGQTEAVKPLY